MSSHKKSSSSGVASHKKSSSSSATSDDDYGVKPVKLGFREMLSYGHKPWDDDYKYWKKTLEDGFTKGEREAAADARNKAMWSQKNSSSTSATSDDDYGVKPVKLGFHEMLSYGHKPWDDDYYYWKETLEDAFTKGEREAAADARREACASKSSNKAKSSSSGNK